MSKQIDLRDCPKTLNYLGLGSDPIEESLLSNDIDILANRLPCLVTMLDDDKSLTNMCIEISYILEHLKGIKDELQKGGAA